MVTSRREAKGKKGQYIPKAPWTCLHPLTQLWCQQCPPERCSGPALFLWGIWGCFFRPISSLRLPQEPFFHFFSCSRIHTWPGYILSCVSSSIPELAMANYVQHFQNIFLFEAEKPGSSLFPQGAAEPQTILGLSKSFCPSLGSQEGSSTAAVTILRKLKPLETGVILCFFIELVRFLFYKMVAAETTLDHPYLQLPLFLEALESMFTLSIVMLRAAWCLMRGFFPFLLSVPEVQVLLIAALPGRACDELLASTRSCL